MSAGLPQDLSISSCHCLPSYPTIYWVPAKHKSMPEKYEGAREVKVCVSFFLLLHVSLTNARRTSWRTLRSTPRFPSKLPRPRRPRPRRASRRTSSDPIGCASAMRLLFWRLCEAGLVSKESLPQSRPVRAVCSRAHVSPHDYAHVNSGCQPDRQARPGAWCRSRTSIFF